MYTKTIACSTVDNRNRCNDITNILSAQLKESFEPFLFKKVRKISGYKGFLKATNKIIESYTTDKIIGLNSHDKILIFGHYTSLICQLQLWDAEEKRYTENTIYFGRFDDETGILTALAEPTEYRTDLNIDEFHNAQNNIRELKKELEKHESVIKEFRL